MLDSPKSTLLSHRLGTLLAALGIYPGEGAVVGLLFSQSFLLGVSFFSLYTTGTAIFLSHFEASAVAYVYVISALLLILIGVFFNQLERRLPFSLLLIGSLGGLLFTLLLLRIGLWVMATSWVAFLLMIAIRVSWTLMNLVVWAAAGRLLNVRQSKRLFPLIVVGTVLAIIFSGLVNQQLINLMGVFNLLWLSIGALVSAIGLMVLTLRQFQDQVATNNGSGTTGPVQSWSAQLSTYRNRYIGWMIVLSVLSTLSSYLLEFIFFREANVRYQETEAYASFFGTYLGVTTLILLVVSFVSGPILNRLGLKVGLQINPIIVTILALLFLISNWLFGSWQMYFWLVVLTKLGDDVLVVSMSNTAMRILFQPISAAQRLSVQTLLESMVVPAAIGLVGLFFIALQFIGEVSTPQLFGVLVLLCFGWVFASSRVHNAYLEALRKALLKRRFEAIEATEISAEATQVLHEGLRSKHPDVVLYSLNMLEAGQTTENKEAAIIVYLYPDLLTHAIMEVRLEIAQRMEKMAWSTKVDTSTIYATWLPVVQKQLAEDPSVQVRGFLCRTMLALVEISDDGESLRIASEYLTRPDDTLRNAALVGLLRHGGIQSILMAGPQLLALANAPSEVNRVLAAKLVGQVGQPKFYQPLMHLLNDEESTVRNAAIQASGHVKNAALWPLVGQRLIDSSTRKQAIHVLAQGGESVLPTLSNLFAMSSQSNDVRAILPGIAGKIGGQKANTLLWGWLEENNGVSENKVIRDEIWRALRRSGYRAEAESDQQRQIFTQIAELLAQISWLGSAWQVVNEVNQGAVNNTPSTSLLAEALITELEQTRSSLFELLTFICNRLLVMQVRHIFAGQRVAYQVYAENHQSYDLSSENNEQRAYAQEVLDDLLPSEFKSLLLPFLAEDLSNRSLAAIQKRYPVPSLDYAHWLLTLINASESQIIPWTKACALYASGQLPKAEQVETGLLVALKAQQQNQQPIIQETANWVLKSGV